jgi:NADH:ubiquinone oxidoreductase subunit 2 (subunit N)
LLRQLFSDNTLGAFLLTVCINSWYVYYLSINITTTPATQNSDVKKPKTIELTGSMRIIMIGSLVLWLILLNATFILNMTTSSIFYDSIYCSQNTTSYLYLVLGLFMIILFLGVGLFHQNISFSGEYIIFVLLIIISSYLLISSSNLFLTIFLLELVALLIFGKMAVSRVTIKKSRIDTTNTFNKPPRSYGLFNSLFFQFWANFVSSICLFFSLLNIHYMFGTSHFFLINFLLSLISSNWYLMNVFVVVSLLVLLTGFFIKLGLTPYQFFKIEIYKGIPVYIIIVYTTIYLVIYIHFYFYFYIN